MKKLAFILLLSLTAAGQQPKDKTHIHISCTCEDQVGELFATALRDAIANSPRFIEVTEAEVKGSDGKLAQMNWALSIVTLDAQRNNPGNFAAISVAMTLGNDIFLTNWVQTCARMSVSGCAAQTLANLDSNIHAR